MTDSIVSEESLAKLVQQDPRFAHILDLYGPPPDWRRPPGFSTLCQMILEQQVSLESAAACFRKLSAQVQPFSPSQLLEQSDASLRACGLSRQKSRYVRLLAEAIESRELVLESLSNLVPSEARERLKSVVGIGNWTAEIYMIFCLRQPDVFPLGDIAAVRTVRELWAANDASAIEQQTLLWTPHRTLATFCCWHYYLKQRGRVAPYEAR